jgi:D-tyrosyl-tRNA(Tyr) deacylase
MRVVLQRVLQAAAHDGDRLVGEIGKGLVLYVGVGPDDTAATVAGMARKLANLRVFEAGESKFGRSVVDAAGDVLTVSQFTLHADTSRGRRPNFSRGAPVDVARSCYEALGPALGEAGVDAVVAIPFASRVVLDVRNWGPFTMVLER